jgi:hypothetical protein
MEFLQRNAFQLLSSNAKKDKLNLNSQFEEQRDKQNLLRLAKC